MTVRLSLITTCKGRLHHLQQTLPRMAAQADAECIVVDYGCPQGAGDWVRANHPGVRIVRVDDDPHFNQCRARNRGAIVAETGLFCFVDADILLAPDFTSRILDGWAPNTFLRARPVTIETWGSFACPREEFWRVGGYDEVFQGWGASPEDLYLRLAGSGCAERHFAGSLLTALGHGDESRTAFYANKDRWWQHRANALYLIAKHDLAKVLGMELSLPQRQALYAQANLAIDGARATGSDRATLDLTIENDTTRAINLLVQVDRRLAYSIRWPGPAFPGAHPEPDAANAG